MPETSSASSRGSPTPRLHRRPLRTRNRQPGDERAASVLTLFAGALIGLLVGVGLTRLMTSAPRPAVTSRVLLNAAPANQLRAAAADQTLSFGHLSRPAIALSPDGQTLVFTGVQGTRQQLYVRPLAQLEATPLPGTDGAMSPFFSPDGQSIGFWADGFLKRISLGGGAPTTLCATELIFGASWGTTDVVVFAHDNGGLWKVSARGGSPVAITTLDTAAGEVGHRLPQLLSGDEAVMFTVTRTTLPTWDDTQIVIQPLAGATRTLLVDGGADARYVPTGHIIYMRRGVLLAAPFDLAQRRVTGGSTAVVPDVMQSANMINTTLDSGAGQFGVFGRRARSRTSGAASTSFQGGCSSGAGDRTGRIEPLDLPARAYNYPRLSPEGNRVAVSTQGDRNIWMYDIGRGTTARVTVDGRNMAPTWTPDGIRLTFGSSAGGQENLVWQTADGNGAAERLTTAHSCTAPARGHLTAARWCSSRGTRSAGGTF